MPRKVEVLFTDARRDRFLELIRDGLTRQQAAQKLREETGEERMTSTRWRSLVNRDKEFGQRYLETLQESGRAPSPLALEIKDAEGIHFAHAALDEAILRALDPERGKVGASNRMLHNLLLLKAEDFRPLLEARTRHIHEGAVGIYAMPHIDYSRWTLEEHEEFIALDQRRSELIAKAQIEVAPTKRAPLAELPSGVKTLTTEQVG